MMGRKLHRSLVAALGLIGLLAGNMAAADGATVTVSLWHKGRMADRMMGMLADMPAGMGMGMGMEGAMHGMEMAAMGICGLTVDEKYGGLGQDVYAAVAVIEELSRILPDDAYVNGISIDTGRVVADGAAAAPEPLIALFEASPHFSNVSFNAPVFRNPGEAKSRFSIKLELEARQ